MVWLSSVTGNMRPSPSVFSETPLAPNHPAASAGPKRDLKGPISCLPPRGYPFAISETAYDATSIAGGLVHGQWTPTFRTTRRCQE